MSGISTHVLDTSTGTPAASVRVRLFRNDVELHSVLTNQDGRCPAILPPGIALTAGPYRLVFEIGPYFAECFYPEVQVTFVVGDVDAHYHVPLLISPFGFTTYRGT